MYGDEGYSGKKEEHVCAKSLIEKESGNRVELKERHCGQVTENRGNEGTRY